MWKYFYLLGALTNAAAAIKEAARGNGYWTMEHTAAAVVLGALFISLCVRPKGAN